jgi:probable rRNA maturation factor
LLCLGKTAENRQRLIILRKPAKDINQAALARFAARACRAVGIHGEYAILITGNSEIKTLNLRFRKKNMPTDVISFPSEMEGVAGDIAISLDIASRNGRKMGHGTLAELKILILHGMLHLAGMDHEKDDGQMERREKRLRRELGLPEGLIERTYGSGGRTL